MKPSPEQLASRLPGPYRFLATMVPAAPNMVLEALYLYGTKETPGKANTPEIIEWARELEAAGVLKKGTYTADETAWCGLFVAICAKRAGWTPPKDPLWALNWGNFGVIPSAKPSTSSILPSLGDVATFKRRIKGGWAGHVGIIVGEDNTHYHLIAGNTSDSVTFQRKPKGEVVAVRRPPYSFPPLSVKPWKIGSSVVGASQKEA